MPKFSIGHILTITTLIAVGMAIVIAVPSVVWLYVVGITVLLLLLFALLGPAFIIFASIAFARQKDGHLDIASNPFLIGLQRCWLGCCAILVVLWGLLMALTHWR